MAGDASYRDQQRHLGLGYRATGKTLLFEAMVLVAQGQEALFSD